MKIIVFLLFLISSCSAAEDSQTNSPTSADLQNTDDRLASEALPVTEPQSADPPEKPRCQSAKPFKSLWKVEADEQITLPLPDSRNYNPSHYNFIVDWGDGTKAEVTSYDDPDISHTYSEASEQAASAHEGKYRVTITGLLEAWSFGNSCPDSFIAVEDLGNTCLKSLRKGFRACKNLTQVKGGNTSAVTDMSYAFYEAGKKDTNSLKLHINSWDTSKVTSMAQMFTNAGITFECDDDNPCPDNANLKNWQTSQVRNMLGMFKKLTTANPDVSNWRTDNLNNIEMMFQDSEGADPDVSNWNFSKINRFKDFAPPEESLSDDNYCKLIIALGQITLPVLRLHSTNDDDNNNIPTRANRTTTQGAQPTNCVAHDGFCAAKQVLERNANWGKGTERKEWDKRSGGSCPSQN